MPNKLEVRFNTRWPMKQVGECSFVVQVPFDGNCPILSPEFCKEYHLADSEIEVAEQAAIREVAIIR